MAYEHISYTGLADVLKIVDSIPTPTCGGGQPRSLFELSFSCEGRGTIVEIGSMAGRSTIALAYGQKVKNGQKVYAIDCSPHKELLPNLERAGVASWVEVLVGWSSKIAKNWRESIELLFIDGNHSFLGCRSDIRCWTPHVIDGGFVIFHDYGNVGYSGVQRAVRWELASRPEMWRTISDREVGSLYVLQRRSGQPSPDMAFPQRVRQFLMARETIDWLKGEVKALRQG